MTVQKRHAVWVVDDVDSVRDALAAVLETAGLTVRACASADEFLRRFDPADKACLIVDQQMPGMTGVALLQHLQDRALDIPAIVMTASGTPRLEEKVRAAGGRAMLHKPVDGDELIKFVTSAFANGS